MTGNSLVLHSWYLCSYARRFFLVILCRDCLFSEYISILGRALSIISVPSQLKRHNAIPQRTLKEMEKANVNSVLYKSICVCVRLSTEEL